MRKFLMITGSVLFLILAHSVNAQSDKQQYINDSRSMYDTFQKSGLDSAKTYWETKAEIYGNTDGRYENDMGQLFMAAEKYRESLSWFEKSSELDTFFPYPHLNVAKVSMILHDYDHAAGILENLMNKLPGWEPSFRLSTELAFRMENYKTSVIIGTQALTLKEHFATYYFMALSYYQLEQIEEAKFHAKKSMKMNPQLKNDQNLVKILE